MSTLYFDCGMGAAGDMLTAAVLELFDNPEKMLEELNALNIPHTQFILEESIKCGIKGSHIRVIVDDQEEDEHIHEHHHHDHNDEHHHHHSHSGMHDIEHIVNDHINVNDKVRKNILAVYRMIAEAESKVHNTTIENIHFHEVGTMDAIADVTAFCYLIDKLGVKEVYASAVHVGKGTVKCAHGILPVPAPATAEILKDVPIYSKELIDGELCTPTGAALLKHFVKEFKAMPVMKIKKIGYGMGTKDFAIANCVRAVLGEDVSSDMGVVRELDFNVDDMTGEEIGFLTDTLLKNGAFEVFVIPIQMKKGRPGNLISVLCSKDNEQAIIELIFKHSTTIGIRESTKDRFILERHIEEKQTEFGVIRKKISSGYGVYRSKFEYDDLSRIAKETGLSIKEILERIDNE